MDPWPCDFWFLLSKVYGVFFLLLACGMLVAYCSGRKARQLAERAQTRRSA